jgi:predicted transcriptional regulator
MFPHLLKFALQQRRVLLSSVTGHIYKKTKDCVGVSLKELN